MAFDPLDGSSIIGANFAVGAIFGVWSGDCLLGRTGAEQVAAAYAVFGSRTSLVVAQADPGAQEAHQSVKCTIALVLLTECSVYGSSRQLCELKVVWLAGSAGEKVVKEFTLICETNRYSWLQIQDQIQIGEKKVRPTGDWILGRQFWSSE